MKKVLDFIKSNMIIAKWTFWYFFILWLILRLVFHFDPLNAHYWWKFFHATFHGFAGFVFGLLVYTAIPIYIATTAIIYRKKELIITIPFIDKVFEFIKKLFPKKQITEPVTEVSAPEIKEPEPTGPEYPDDMPPELRIPYMRAKNNLSLTGAVSAYNKQKAPAINTIEKPKTESDTMIPLPTDFDLSDSDTFGEFNESEIPTFTDINFDTEKTDENFENNATKYFKSKNIEYETYKQFVATEKYVIYEHSDNDFWIMDENVWFASGKQIDSPIKELIELGRENGLTPILYLASQNIMDIETVIEQFESMGVRVIKNLDELN